jgi:hypothetical protein
MIEVNLQKNAHTHPLQLIPPHIILSLHPTAPFQPKPYFLSISLQMEHPEVVTELVLRGIFLLRKKEINWFYQGPGKRK